MANPAITIFASLCMYTGTYKVVTTLGTCLSHGQGDQTSLRNYRPKCSPTNFCQNLCTTFTVEISSIKIWATSLIFMKTTYPKGNIGPMGKKSPNLVTLLTGKLFIKTIVPYTLQISIIYEDFSSQCNSEKYSDNFRYIACKGQRVDKVHMYTGEQFSINVCSIFKVKLFFTQSLRSLHCIIILIRPLMIKLTFYEVLLDI
jgi:hypothetical protein